MKNDLAQFYREEKDRVIRKCKECGVCAKKCPIVEKTGLADVSPRSRMYCGIAVFAGEHYRSIEGDDESIEKYE